MVAEKKHPRRIRMQRSPLVRRRSLPQQSQRHRSQVLQNLQHQSLVLPHRLLQSPALLSQLPRSLQQQSLRHQSQVLQNLQHQSLPQRNLQHQSRRVCRGRCRSRVAAHG